MILFRVMRILFILGRHRIGICWRSQNLENSSNKATSNYSELSKEGPESAR